jgi:hypothetical protein
LSLRKASGLNCWPELQGGALSFGCERAGCSGLKFPASLRDLESLREFCDPGLASWAKVCGVPSGTGETTNPPRERSGLPSRFGMTVCGGALMSELKSLCGYPKKALSG